MRKSKIRLKTSLINQMNVVPYIDVTLVLLIIFMVTAPMFVPGVINLPQVGKASHLNINPLQISINYNGIYSLKWQDKSSNFSNLDDLLNVIISSSTFDTPIVISGDKNISYNRVIHLIDKLYTKGFKKVALAVRERNE
jgi:biopolymer transport protein TolR